MKKNFIVLASMAACLGMMAPAHADINDKAWKQYVEYSQSRPKLVATRMTTSFKMSEGKDAENGTCKSERVAGASGEKPKWVVVDKGTASESMQNMTTLDVSPAAKVAEHPNDLLEETTAVERVGHETVGGKEWVILKAQTRMKGTKRPVELKIWVNQETGQPLKIEGAFDKVPLPGAKDMRFSINYEQAGDAAVLPKLVKFHFTYSLLFKSSEMDMAQELSGWKPL